MCQGLLDHCVLIIKFSGNSIRAASTFVINLIPAFWLLKNKQTKNKKYTN